MPKIRWTNLPPSLRQHLFDRVADRQIPAEDLYKLKLWRESEPDAPDGSWYKAVDLVDVAIPTSLLLETGGERQCYPVPLDGSGPFSSPLRSSDSRLRSSVAPPLAQSAPSRYPTCSQ